MSALSGARVYLTANGTTLAFKLIDLDALTGGNVDWQAKTRKRGKYINAPGGQLPLVYTLPLRLDGMGVKHSADRSVRASMKTLWTWEQFRTSGGKTADPPLITLAGGVRSPAGMKWILTNITEGAYQVNEKGVLVQYDVTLELTEYVGTGTASSPAATAKAKALASAYASLAKQFGTK